MSRELKPYPEYKDSGVEWIGEVPEEWETVRIKYLVNLQNNNKNNKSLPYLGLENIESKTGKILSIKNEDIESQSIKFINGDILFGKLRPYLAKVTQVNFIGHCSTEFLVMTPKINHERYLMYLMLSANFISVVNSSTYGTKMPRASWEFIGNIQIPRMKNCEEMQIVEFLDQKTSEIDALIADKEKLITLLEEKRQAVITETVTKGLDPNVKMKDSGIEWIGEIPEHWEVKKIKYIFSETDRRNTDKEALLLSLYTDIGVRPRSEMIQKGNKAQTLQNYKKVNSGDVVVNKLLAWMGAIGMSNYDGVTSPDYDVYRVKDII